MRKNCELILRQAAANVGHTKRTYVEEVARVEPVAVQRDAAASHQEVDELGDELLGVLVRAEHVVPARDDDGEAEGAVYIVNRVSLVQPPQLPPNPTPPNNALQNPHAPGVGLGNEFGAGLDSF